MRCVRPESPCRQPKLVRAGGQSSATDTVSPGGHNA
jgi:hypothetical protein